MYPDSYEEDINRVIVSENYTKKVYLNEASFGKFKMGGIKKDDNLNGFGRWECFRITINQTFLTN